MDYTTVKYLHIAAVCLSITGFVFRFAGLQTGARWVSGKLARTAPHANDTVLLLSAVMLLYLSGMNPLSHPWLAAKITALLIYIAVGMIALKLSRPRRVRFVGGVLAVVAFSYIVTVAITKHPAGWFAIVV